MVLLSPIIFRYQLLSKEIVPIHLMTTLMALLIVMIQIVRVMLHVL